MKFLFHGLLQKTNKPFNKLIDQGFIDRIFLTYRNSRELHVPVVEVRVQSCDGRVGLELFPQGDDDDERDDTADGGAAEPEEPEGRQT